MLYNKKTMEFIHEMEGVANYIANTYFDADFEYQIEWIPLKYMEAIYPDGNVYITNKTYTLKMTKYENYMSKIKWES